jgi:predicted amidohydrolase YtcJ
MATKLPVRRQVAVLASIGLVVMSCEPGADVLMTGGRVWTGRAPGRAATPPTAIAVAEGRVVALGTDAEVTRHRGRDTRHIDLAGRLVVPGLMDAHTHFIEGGFTLAGVQLRDAATPDEFARRIGEYARAHPGSWMTGGTWDHELWGGELPRREWIDSVTPDTPVFVTRLDGHMSLANSRAIALAGVTAATPDPPGGTIVRRSDGEPAGVFKDAAQDLIFEVMPEASDEELDRALDAAVAQAVARGVTMITDMGTWAGHEAYRRAHAEGRLPIRVYSVVPMVTWERLATYVEREGRGDQRLFWGGVKAFVDGSLGSTTAWFYDPYTDDPSTSGLMVTDTAQLRASILAADAAGLQLIVHAIGDRANDWLLDVFQEAEATNGRRDRRARIEHAQHLRTETMQRIAAMGVIASMQPYHAVDDGRWAEKRIGPERSQGTYAFRSLLDAGARVAFGSDWTVAPLDPMLGVHAAVTRRTIDGAHPDGWVPGEKISVEEALRAYTAEAAFAGFLDPDLGTLTEGALADLVVLSRDILSIDTGEIERVAVDLTMVDGDVVYEREGAAPTP